MFVNSGLVELFVIRMPKAGLDTATIDYGTKSVGISICRKCRDRLHFCDNQWEFFDLGEGIDLWTQIVYGTKVYKNNLCGFNILMK